MPHINVKERGHWVHDWDPARVRQPATLTTAVSENVTIHMIGMTLWGALDADLLRHILDLRLVLATIGRDVLEVPLHVLLASILPHGEPKPPEPREGVTDVQAFPGEPPAHEVLAALLEDAKSVCHVAGMSLLTGHLLLGRNIAVSPASTLAMSLLGLGQEAAFFPASGVELRIWLQGLRLRDVM